MLNTNTLNKRFYEQHAQSFSKTRQYPWIGWKNLIEILREFKRPVIADLGCGNARFLEFLYKNNLRFSKYIGVDFSKELLKIASEKNKRKKNIKFIKKDLVEYRPKSSSIDIAVLFGISHHLTEKQLKQVTQNIHNGLKKEGLLIISFWQINKKERFKKLVSKKINNKEYLLKWKGRKAQRYYRVIEEKEIKDTFERYKKIKSFTNEGKDKNLNKYIIFKKNQASSC